MRFESIQDLLEHGYNLHYQVADFYHQLYDVSDRTRVKLLLDYLAEHERRLAGALKTLRSVSDPGLLQHWLTQLPDPEQLATLLHTPIRGDMDVDEVLAIALHFDAALIMLYHTLAEHCEDHAVRELLNNLVELEHAEQRRMVRDTMMLQDL